MGGHRTCAGVPIRLTYPCLQQRQNLSEVENLYFRHTHKSRPVATPKENGHRAMVTGSTRYTPNMLFPVNEGHHAQDTDSRGQKDAELSAGLAAENGSVAVVSGDVGGAYVHRIVYACRS